MQPTDRLWPRPSQYYQFDTSRPYTALGVSLGFPIDEDAFTQLIQYLSLKQFELRDQANKTVTLDTLIANDYAFEDKLFVYKDNQPTGWFEKKDDTTICTLLSPINKEFATQLNDKFQDKLEVESCSSIELALETVNIFGKIKFSAEAIRQISTSYDPASSKIAQEIFNNFMLKYDTRSTHIALRG